MVDVIGLWHRWFDAREHRAARERAEQNYSQALIKVTSLNRRLADEAAAHAVTKGRLADAERERDALAEALDGHNDRLYEELTNKRKAYADAVDTCAALRRELERLRTEVDPKTQQKIADEHAEVSKLPPVLTRDRQALSRLEDELAHAREQIEKCRREHR